MSDSKCLVMADDFKVHFQGEVAVNHQPSVTESPRFPPFAGWTFGEFIDACRRLGLRDHDRLASVEFGICSGTRCLKLDEGADGYEVRERFR